jgi:serine/threonine-protein kinase HipA
MKAPDGHAKNYSIMLLNDNAPVLAPLYDIASGILFKDDKGLLKFTKMAMSIMGENRFGYLTINRIKKFIDYHGLDDLNLIERFNELKENIPDAINDVLAKYKYISGIKKVGNKILKSLKERKEK